MSFFEILIASFFSNSLISFFVNSFSVVSTPSAQGYLVSSLSYIMESRIPDSRIFTFSFWNGEFSRISSFLYSSFNSLSKDSARSLAKRFSSFFFLSASFALLFFFNEVPISMFILSKYFLKSVTSLPLSSRQVLSTSPNVVHISWTTINVSLTTFSTTGLLSELCLNSFFKYSIMSLGCIHLLASPTSEYLP